MGRVPNRFGGGANTNVNGLGYERDTNLLEFIESLEGFSIQDNKVLKNGIVIAENFSKHSLYRDYLVPKGIDYRDYISSQLLPDEAFITSDKCYIIEKKFQAVSGSVDEKLHTFIFKREQYQKMFSELNIKVEFYYLLSDWFKADKYTDSLTFIEKYNAKYFFNVDKLIEDLGF